MYNHIYYGVIEPYLWVPGESKKGRNMQILRYLMPLLMFIAMSPVMAEAPLAPTKLSGVTRLDAENVVAMILNHPELVVIDSRLEESYAKGHIENAVNLPDTAMTPETLAQYASRPDTPLLFYCQGKHCLRSSYAAKKARQWGYRQIYWFRGGWVDWRDKKLPVAR